MGSTGPDMYHHNGPIAMALIHFGAAHGLVSLAAFGGVLAAGALALPRLRRALHRT